MESDSDHQLRKRLVRHLNGGEAFTPAEMLSSRIPFEKTGVIPDKLPYSFYQQFCHLRLAQYDILEFSRNPAYVSPGWPGDYWPESIAPQNYDAWRDLTRAYVREREEFCQYISDPALDLFQPIPHGQGQTLLREALLVIEHSAYHTGQLFIIARLLNVYPSENPSG